MKDPESTRFRDVVHSPPHGKVTADIVCGWVNSKNSFGGYAGYQRFVVFGNSVLVEGTRSDVMDDLLASAWKECMPATVAGG